MLNKIFCLVGPTASGKTTLACKLVQQFPFEIISVDSAMIYRDMDIGTAKPNQTEQALAYHHLIDVIDPPESFSVAQFCQEAMRLCAAIFLRGKIPLLVGGTMMYFHALQQGLSILPDADPVIRAQINNEAKQQGWTAMHTQLDRIDPSTAAKIHPNDTQRIQRALEVYYLTGKSLSVFLSEQKQPSPYTYINFFLFPSDRSWLHRQIALRFHTMLQQGFIHEVEALLHKWCLPPHCPAMRCVGYRQALRYLSGIDDYATFCDSSISATRQLAKRQLTWLRHWPQKAYLLDCGDMFKNNYDLIAIINKILDN